MLGIIIFAWPGITLAALVFLYGAYALLDGVVSLDGFAGIAAAVVTVLWPPVTALALSTSSLHGPS